MNGIKGLTWFAKYTVSEYGSEYALVRAATLPAVGWEYITAIPNECTRSRFARHQSAVSAPDVPAQSPARTELRHRDCEPLYRDAVFFLTVRRFVYGAAGSNPVSAPFHFRSYD